MSPLLSIIALLLRAAPGAFARGAALSLAVLLMGAALLGLSGWFITATGLAGLAGIGIAFDVFRPSAGIRFLALGRTASRYGERLLTHDATLRALAALRVSLLRRAARGGGRALLRLRGEAMLTRIVADVDALDGVLLRLVLPLVAGLASHAAVFAVLWWLCGFEVAAVVLLGLLPASALILWWLARRTGPLSDRAETAAQALQRGMIDTIRDREALILAGRLADAEHALVGHDRASRAALTRLDGAERGAGAALALTLPATVAGALVVGAWMIAEGRLDPARAAIGVFVALALGETILPLRRGVAELGRMRRAAGRLVEHENGGLRLSGDRLKPKPDAPALDLPTLSLTLAPGEAVALTGPSGCGKTTLLLQIAGLEPGEDLRVFGHAPTEWEEQALRAQVAYLPQRSALMSGTIREALVLAGAVSDAEMCAALDVVELSDVLAPRGGLDARLGESGAGLSGGQSRRLALARCLLRRPALLLLDEPTEGLDAGTAARLLSNLRRALPEAAILAVMHQGTEHPIFERRIAMTRAPGTSLSPAELTRGHPPRT